MKKGGLPHNGCGPGGGNSGGRGGAAPQDSRPPSVPHKSQPWGCCGSFRVVQVQERSELVEEIQAVGG